MLCRGTVHCCWMRVQKETSQKMAYSVPYIHYSRHQHVKAENKPVLGYINYSPLSDSHTNPRKHSCSPPCWSDYIKTRLYCITWPTLWSVMCNDIQLETLNNSSEVAIISCFAKNHSLSKLKWKTASFSWKSTCCQLGNR